MELSLVTHVLSGPIGCALAGHFAWQKWGGNFKQGGNIFAPRCKWTEKKRLFESLSDLIDLVASKRISGKGSFFFTGRKASILRNSLHKLTRSISHRGKKSSVGRLAQKRKLIRQWEGRDRHFRGHGWSPGKLFALGTSAGKRAFKCFKLTQPRANAKLFAKVSRKQLLFLWRAMENVEREEREEGEIANHMLLQMLPHSLIPTPEVSSVVVHSSGFNRYNGQLLKRRDAF